MQRRRGKVYQVLPVTDTDPPGTGNMLRYYYLLQRLVVVADVDGSASSVEVLALRKDVGTKTLSPSSVSTEDPQNTQKNIVDTVYVLNLLEIKGLRLRLRDLGPGGNSSYYPVPHKVPSSVRR
jgi:hypothetical protein